MKDLDQVKLLKKLEVDEKKFNFLYLDGENCHFMDNTTFEQVEIPKSITGEQYKLLKRKSRSYNFFHGGKTNFNRIAK